MAGIERPSKPLLSNQRKLKGLTLSVDSFRWNDGRYLTPTPQFTKVVLQFDDRRLTHNFPSGINCSGPSPGKRFRLR